MKPEIPFNRPTQTGNELSYISEVIQGGRISGEGKFTKACNHFLEKHIGSKKSILTTSCTDALEMSAMLLNLSVGDEVLVPSYTFVSSANAFASRGVKPVFIDIRRDTLNIDENLIEANLSPRTKAIVVVHYAGVACEMDTIIKIANKHGLDVIEDNAHGLFGFYKGRPLGSMGTLATLSFHETKNLTCGEGGALLVNDLKYADRAEVLRDKGTNRKKFLDGQVDKYTWVDVGSSFLPSDILAAFLYAQLQEFETIQTKRKSAWNMYNETLQDKAKKYGFLTPYIPSYCSQAFHMYYLLCESKNHRDKLIGHLVKSGIQSVFHYLPLNTSPMGKLLGGLEGQCPVSEEISGRIIRLPFYTDIQTNEIEKVVEGIGHF